jgi:hypothetical protein
MKPAPVACSVLLCLFSFALSGCGSAARIGAATVGFAVGTTMAVQRPEAVRIVYEAPPGYMLVPVPESEPDLAIPDPPKPRAPHGPQFQAAAARNLLDAVPLDACRDAGLPAGWGHALVTFEPDGHVSAITVDAPGGMPEDAVACVSAKLSAVRVPEFGGARMTVGTTWNAR